MFENIQSIDIIFILIGIVVVFAILIIITRAVFSIPKMLRYQKAQIKLLSLIAEQANHQNIDVIKEIVFEADESFKNDEHFADATPQKE